MSLVHRLEAALGILVARLLVGMVFAGELAERLLDVRLARPARHAQRLVVVLILHQVLRPRGCLS